MAFLLGSIVLFSRTEFAVYAYVLVPFAFISTLSETKRNDFLKSCFSKSTYYKVRILENCILVLPFAAFLTYKLMILPVFIMTGVAILVALFNFKSNFNYALPTPFYKKPFEFTVGFRTTFYLFGASYFLTFMAIYVSNFNLGLFALFSVFLFCLLYYLTPENEYYVWSYNLKPVAFLFEKIKTAIIFSTLICIPILAALGYFFSESIFQLFIFLVLGYISLMTIIVTKYSCYPNRMSFIHTLILVGGLVYPYVLVGVIPVFYMQSISKLKQYLK
jgi:hypothetical protein